MRWIVLVFTVFIGSNVWAVNLPSEASGNAAAHCKEEWTKRGVLDTNMYNYCMNQEHEGYLNLVSLARKYSNQSWIQNALNYSIKEWTNRGVRQDRMVHYELNKITEGYEDLVYMSKQPGWNQRKYQACSNNWGIQFYMVVACYKE